MNARPHGLLPWALFAAACAAVAGYLGLRDGFAFTDYDAEASTAAHALAHGHLHEFAATAPSYGGSLVLRAPFAIAAGLLGGGDNAIYRAVALPGLIAVAVLGVMLASVAFRRGASQPACLAIIALAIAAPPVGQALNFGHADELMNAALVVGAVLAARAEKGVLAGVLLGLAIGNKPVALVAAGPVLMALPRGAWRAALISGAVAALVVAPLALLGGGLVENSRMAATDTGAVFKPQQLFYALGHDVVLPRGHHARVAPAWLSGAGRPMLVLLTFGIAVLWRRRGRPSDVLGLLTLVLFLRCALDPWDNLYYHAPFLLALLAWEAHSRRRWPLAAIAIAVILRVAFELLPDYATPSTQAAAYLLWALPTLAILATAVFAPERAAALGRAASARLRRAFPTIAARAASPAATA